MLILFLGYIVSLWAMFPIFRRYLSPPSSGSDMQIGECVCVYVYSLLFVFETKCYTSLYTETDRPNHFDPKDEDSIYLRNVGSVAHNYAV
jgi:hypothetical protein